MLPHSVIFTVIDVLTYCLHVLQTKGDLAKVVLTSPVCSTEGEKLALSRRVEKHWRLIGWGKIRKGTKIVQSED